jgi:hypothetical protein
VKGRQEIVKVRVVKGRNEGAGKKNGVERRGGLRLRFALTNTNSLLPPGF